MLNGYITFRWDDGYEQHIPFLCRLKGIQHKRHRPITYKVSITSGSICGPETAKLNDWLLQVPAVLMLR